MEVNKKSKHYYQNKVFSQLEGRPILFHPGLKSVLGDTRCAMWMSQLLYWYDKGESRDYIRKSRSQFEKETTLTRDQQIRVEGKLKKLGVVSISVRPGRPSPINHITIHFDVLDELILNVRGIRTLDDGSVQISGPQNRLLIDGKPRHQPTQNTNNISESTQKNIQRKHDFNPNGEGYKKALAARDKLIEGMSVK